MKILIKKSVTKEIKIKVKQILMLYGNATLIELLNDLVAIGTWPTPEGPVMDNNIVSNKNGETIAIDSVPLPEMPKKLKVLLDELIRLNEDRKVDQLLEIIKR